jgi:hypothetical protein
MSFSDLVKRNLEEIELGEKKFDSHKSGVHIRHPDLVCKCDRMYDGFIIDWQGNIKQEYSFKYISTLTPITHGKQNYLAQNGYESTQFGLFTLDNKPIWIKDLIIHHEIVPFAKHFFTFGKETHKYRGRLVDFDTIVKLDYDGKELWRWSSYAHFKKLKRLHGFMELDFPKIPLLSFLDPSRRKRPSPTGGYYDYYRFNSLQIIPHNILGETDARFRAGNLLVSARHGSIMFIIDQDTENIVWFMSEKEIQGQHAVQMLENGRLLLFDNGRYRGWSRVIEIDPLSKDISFEYKSESFFSLSRGYVQKLQNGNYLITDSEKGHVFEITSDKKVVWEYYHPLQQNDSRFPKNIGKREWIYRCVALERFE